MIMQINIICVGKLKEGYLQSAAAEYVKRLAPYAKLKIYETPESNLDKEAQGLLKLAPKGHNIALDIKGKALSSEGFARYIEGLGIDGKSSINFFIGGSVGLSEELMRGCPLRLSFSKMTFTHQWARVILLEQVYRAFKIINNEPYHK